jgi:AcrR family transcriptional regulator
MTNEATGEAAATPKPADVRGLIVEALMRLAAMRSFEDISIRDICAEAGVTLADFRDYFPSKGAVLGGFSRRIDRAVLSQRVALREITGWLRRDPVSAWAINRTVLNSMRFMLEAAGIDSEGTAGAVKLQGLALAWNRIVAVWLEDSDPGLSKTLAELDRELTRGERMVQGVERLDQFAAPFKAVARAAMESRSKAREAFRRRPRDADATGDVEAL